MSKITEVINELKIKPKTKASLKETELLIKILTKIEQSFLNNKKCDYSKLMIADSKNEIKYENQNYKFSGYAYSIIFEYKKFRILRLDEFICNKNKDAYIYIDWRTSGLGSNECKIFDLIKEKVNTENLKKVIDNIFKYNNINNLNIDEYKGFVSIEFDIENKVEVNNVIDSIIDTIKIFMDIYDLFEITC